MSKFVYTDAQRQIGVDVYRRRDLPDLMKKLIELAPPPKFKERVVGMFFDGIVYVGVRVQFPNLPLHYTIHPEQFLLINMALTAKRYPFMFEYMDTVKEAERVFYRTEGGGVFDMAISADGNHFGWPCSNCLRLYLEIDVTREAEILLQRPDDISEFKSIKRLVYDRFGPEIPLPKHVYSLREKRDNGLVFSDPESTRYDTLAAKALEAANQSYAPYSDLPSGVVLVARTERVDRGVVSNFEDEYEGWLVESIAEHGRVGPLQAALIDYVARRGEDVEFNNIINVVLVEMENAEVKEEPIAKIILNGIAPNCNFKVIHCRKNL